MLGKKEERKNAKYRNLNHVHHIFREGLLEKARNIFQQYLSILDLSMKVEDLVITFGKIYSTLPKYSRTKNIANLSFAILFKTTQSIKYLKLNSTCEQCGCDLKKILAIFQDLKQYQQLFEKDDTSIILHSLSAVQEKFGILSKDVPYIRKILQDPFTCGLLPQIKAAKVLILYLKAKQLTQFFKILQSEEISDWITLLRHVSDPEWRIWVKSQIQPLNLQNIAKELQISKTQVYTCYSQETWIKSRVVENTLDSVIKCGKLRIPEKCLDAFFTQPKANKHLKKGIGIPPPIKS
ncbi:MAG: hypothetical protein E4G98_06020 [Promethearchaeota archaeon]|nr:MAG: hypothetical protein E4G98_06020 [Candidatus Lokiarchaeota archaeon]